jgi:hypothetical protein
MPTFEQPQPHPQQPDEEPTVTVVLSEIDRKFGDALLKISLCEQYLGELPQSVLLLLYQSSTYAPPNTD